MGRAIDCCWSAPWKQWDSILALNRTFRLPLGPQKKQILIFGCLHWMQLESSFNLSQLWAFLTFFWPRYVIFREPFFHLLTKNPDIPPCCYLSLAHHPIQCQHEFFSAEVVHDWPGLFMSHLVINFYILIPTPWWRVVEKCQFCPFLDTCLVPSLVHVKPIFEAQQSDTGQRLCTHTHEAYSSTTWLFWWQKSIIFLPTRGGGPEKGPAHGHLGTINPKIRSNKQPSRQAF